MTHQMKIFEAMNLDAQQSPENEHQMWTIVILNIFLYCEVCPFSSEDIGHERTGGFNKLSRKIPMVQFILYTCIQSVSESSQEKLLTLKKKMNFNLHKL